MRTFLFSIDLEEVPLGKGLPSRLPKLVEQYLSWLQKHKAACTFFCVGQVAREQPALIKAIADAGHEIALHSDQHVPLPRLGQEGFKRDLEANLEAVYKAGAKEVVGYRAPVFSLTAATPWAHSILAEARMRYSSSVLPEANPLFGWPGFSKNPIQLNTEAGAIWELPMTTGQVGLGPVPIAGGTYLRMMPTWLVKNAVAKAGNVVLGYVHPYDIDAAQPRILHPGLEQTPWLNPLMYIGRRGLLKKLDALMDTGASIMTYKAYVTELENAAHLLSV